MRLGEPGAERPAVLAPDGRCFDLSGITRDIDGSFLASDGIARTGAALAAGALPEIERDGVRMGAPIARPGKIVCIGLTMPRRPEPRSPSGRWCS
jgi:hypothetical protein